MIPQLSRSASTNTRPAGMMSAPYAPYAPDTSDAIARAVATIR